MTATNQLVYVDTGYACFGLVLDADDRVVDAAPIAKWAIGKDAQFVRAYWSRKRQLRAWVVVDGGRS